MAETVSLQQTLTEKWTAHAALSAEGIREADWNLARIALIYGGQLYFDFEEASYQAGKKN